MPKEEGTLKELPEARYSSLAGPVSQSVSHTYLQPSMARALEDLTSLGPGASSADTLASRNAQTSVQVFFVPTDDGPPRPSQPEPNDPQQKWRRSAGNKLNVQRNSSRLHRP
jgi:hypothetical protein